ncbi:MAG: phosphatidylserine decarboxylase [Nevskiaceae bacterium]|nr:MAG: phosphatidylserine decarboxylase [Nevskiaceae bacterium]
MYLLTRIEWPWFKNAFIRVFMRGFDISLAEAQHGRPEDYRSFNDFFTRALKPGARAIAPAPAFLSPVDGTISQLGAIRDGRIFQAKGHDYSAVELLGGDALTAKEFLGGQFATIYLAPYNYHRIHMPVGGRLRHWRYVPGRLFSVNPATARAMPNLFARNERVVAVFDTERGPLAMVLVGALFVGSMETVWAGQISPPHKRETEGGNFVTELPVKLARAEEMGRFNMGSTVILLTAPGALQWDGIAQPGATVRMGQALGR